MIKKRLLFYINSFFNLIFPRTCVVCGKVISLNEKYICTDCLYKAPRTGFQHDKDNPIAQVFWGQIELVAVTSLFMYSKESGYSRLLYRLKYRGMKNLAFYLGQHLGREIADSLLFADVDIIMPVPLHPKKKKMRGYNQSEWIVRGIASVFPREISVDNLYRTVFTNTQTRKSREERWLNVAGKFALRDAYCLKNKHILIVDDVLTTGSTIKACADILLAVEGLRLSVATLAKA